MGAREQRLREPYQDAIEYLCVNLEELSAQVGDARWPETVEAVRTGEQFTEAWCAAVRLLHDLAEDAGIPGGLGLTTPMGTGWPAAPVERTTGWVCPADTCSRVYLSKASDGRPRPEPRCRLLGQAMRFVGG